MNPFYLRGIFHLLTGFINLSLVFILWLKGKDKATYHFGWSALFSAVHAFAHFGVFSLWHSVFWHRACWFGIPMLSAYIVFVYYFTDRTKYIRAKIIFWYGTGLALSFIALLTPLFVKDITQNQPRESILGPLEPVGRIYIMASLAIIIFYLLRAFFKTQGIKRLQLRYFILGTVIYGGGGFFISGVIPLIWPGFLYTDATVYLSVFWIVLTTYAIFKQKLFAIRVIVTEILIAVIGLILLIQTGLAQTGQARVLGIITFFAFLLVGYLLVKVTQKEIARKEEAESLAEKLKELNETLEERVEERTKELEESYHEIKKRKDELEKFYQLTVGREMKMIELKKKIKELEDKI